MATNIPAGPGGNPYAAELDNPIVRFLRQLRFGSFRPTGGMGRGLPMGAPSVQPTAAVPSRSAGTPSLPDYAAEFGARGTPEPGAMRSPFAAFGSQLPPVGGELPSPGPSTKTEPRAPLRFAWGGREPEEYVPGETDILRMEGAPTTRPGLPGTRFGPQGAFEGPAAVAGGREPGGFAPSQTDWSKVANPLAFEAFTERPLREEVERATRDPLWRERELAELEASGRVRAAEAPVRAEAEVVAKENERRNREVAALAQQWIDRANAERRAVGQPPLKLDEESQYYIMAQQRFVGTGKSV